jgi:microcystin-dependent protein
MAKIEIFENSLLRLLVRRGNNADRVGAVLAQGELGYTTDTKKLYVGDGSTAGGILIGNVFAGSTNNVTSLTNVSPGDQAFDDDNKLLYRFKSGDTTDINNWEVIGGVYTAGDSTLLQTGNTFTVGVVSAGNIDPGIVGNSLTFTGGDIALNTQAITTNSVLPYDTTYLSLPGKLKINNVSYEWPLAVASNLYLTSDITGSLRWDNLTQASTLFVPGTAGQIPVGSIMPFASAANAPSGWLLCNGQTVASATYPQLYGVIGFSYGGNSTNFKVPDLTNKAIYGTASSPGTSTVYSLCAKTTNVSTLSATGMLYIIKAVSDPIVNSTISFAGGLSSILNGVTSTGNIVTALSGNHIVGLPQLTTSQTITGAFNIDSFGRVLNPASPPPAVPAGTETPAGSNFAYNASSPIAFLKTPVTFYKHSSEADPLLGEGLPANTPESFFGTITAYPLITVLSAAAPNSSTLPPGVASPSTAIPSNAKNLIIESRVTKFNENVHPSVGPSRTPRLIVSAPDIGLLDPTNPRLVASTEYTVSYVKGFDGPNINPGTPECNVSQVFLPLSASPTGDLIMSFRSPVNFSDAVVLRVVGYTL